jgi:hypothetical protein
MCPLSCYKEAHHQERTVLQCQPSANAPLLITTWIMDVWVNFQPLSHHIWLSACSFLDRCDEISLDGKKKASATVWMHTYTHAQKMQAAMTYAFGCLCGLGTWGTKILVSPIMPLRFIVGFGWHSWGCFRNQRVMINVSGETLKATTYLSAQEPLLYHFCPLLCCYKLIEGVLTCCGSADWD